MAILPYLTSGLPGIGGRLKERPEDFRVEEIPLVRPSGRGRHAYFRVLKREITTPQAVVRIARFLGVHPGQIGFAGLKDAMAVSSQWMSLHEADEDRLRRFRDKQVRIEEVGWHDRRLLAGRLAGNRFVVRVRGVGPSNLPAARAIAEVLQQRGVPNYFGAQRFGSRGDNALLGSALLRGDLEGFVQLFLGRPAASDTPQVRHAREAFDRGLLERAARAWPGPFLEQRGVLAAFARRRRPADAVAAVDRRLRRLYLSAFQSEAFNDILARRIQTLDRVLSGDLVEDHRTGRIRLVRDAQRQQRSAREFELSPTGLLPGLDAPLAEGEPGAIEREVLAKRSISPETFARYKPLRVGGTRRALRYPPEELALKAGSDAHGRFVEVAFVAPAGCYATVLLDEVLKSRPGHALL